MGSLFSRDVSLNHDVEGGLAGRISLLLILYSQVSEDILSSLFPNIFVFSINQHLPLPLFCPIGSFAEEQFPPNMGMRDG